MLPNGAQQEPSKGESWLQVTKTTCTGSGLQEQESLSTLRQGQKQTKGALSAAYDLLMHFAAYHVSLLDVSTLGQQ
jgi:hypothetical protein